LFAHSQKLLGLATCSADIVANDAVQTILQPRLAPWGAHERRRQTRRTKTYGQKTAHLACRLRAPEIVGPALACSGDRNMVPNRPRTCERLEKPRERDRRGGHAYRPWAIMRSAVCHRCNGRSGTAAAEGE